MLIQRTNASHLSFVYLQLYKSTSSYTSLPPVTQVYLQLYKSTSSYTSLPQGFCTCLIVKDISVARDKLFIIYVGVFIAGTVFQFPDKKILPIVDI